MAKSKWFCVAVEGATATDGRTIEKSWLTDIAATYNRATYGARVNLEHIRGFTPDSAFKAYGDVLEVKTGEVELSIAGRPQKKLGLYALIEPTDDLVAFTKAKQKIYTSIEVAPDFAKTGKANLVGLAVTDSPASLGTDILAFSASAKDGPAATVKAQFDARKSDPANVFSAGHETQIELETDETKPEPNLKEALTGFFTELFAKEKPAETVVITAPPAANDNAALMTAVEKGFSKIAETVDARFAQFDTRVAGLQTAHDTLKTSLDNTEKRSTTRPAATGGGGTLADF